MALFACSGTTVLRGLVSFPFAGLWTASLVLEAPAAPSGAVTITAPGLALTGVVARGGSQYERTSVRVVGSTAGRRVVKKFWRGVPLRLPLADVVAAFSGALAADIDPALLAQRLEVWGRAADTGARELDALAAVAGATWRARDDGAIWLGTDAWPAVDLTHRTIAVAEAKRTRTIALEDFSLRPGVTLDGMRLARVTYRIDQERVRCDVVGQP